jgi:hypothetical protein
MPFAARVMAAVVLSACASTPPAPTPRAATAAPGASAPSSAAAVDEGVIETTRSAVRSSTEWLAQGVDSWFGDKPFERGGSVTDGRLALSVLHRQDTGTEFDVRLNARFHLPNLEARSGYLFVGRDNRREVVADTPAEFSRQQRLLPERAGDRSFFAGVGFLLRDALDFRLGLRGGLKPYAQARYRRPWRFGERDLLEFRETVFWSVDDHLGSTTALAYEHVYTPTFALRWLNAATITQAVGKFEWSSSLGTYTLWPRQRVLSLALLASGRQGSGVAVTDYGVQAKWQQPVYRDWLLGNVTVGHFWPRPDAQAVRSRTWALGGGVLMYF